MSTLSGSDMEYLRTLMRRHSANRLDDSKEYLVLARLSPVATRAGLGSVPQLLAAVRQGNHLLRTEVIEAMTINETSFFRDTRPFTVLREHVLPDLLTPRPRALNIWSAAASTGQEPYSLAMMMYDDFPQAPPPRILATDLNQTVLARAAAGEFSQLEVNRGLPAKSLVAHFTQHGRTWQIDDRFRRMVTFRTVNLAKPWPAMPAFDLILLRNVLIYFDDATRADVCARAMAALRPGGYLMLGSAETGLPASTHAERVVIGRTLVFRAPAEGVRSDANTR